MGGHFARGVCRFWAWSVNFTSCFDTWVPETRGIRPLLKRKSQTPRAKTHFLTPSVSRTMAGTWQQQWREPSTPLFSPLFSSAAAIVLQRRRHCSREPPPLFSRAAAIVLLRRRHCSRENPPPPACGSLLATSPRPQAPTQNPKSQSQKPHVNLNVNTYCLKLCHFSFCSFDSRN